VDILFEIWKIEGFIKAAGFPYVTLVGATRYNAVVPV
jgi:hypothetical protein